MPRLGRHHVRIITRHVLSNRVNVVSSQSLSVDLKEAYYDKIGNKAIENEDDPKPEDWIDARPFAEIPGPKPLPIIGNMWRFIPGAEYYKVDIIDLHKRFHEQFGNITYLTGVIGKPPILFLYDPNDIEKVLRNEGASPVRPGLQSLTYYRNHERNDVFEGVSGALVVQGGEWSQFRSKINKILMQPKTVEMYIGSMDEVANGLIENIRHFSASNPRKEMPEDFQTELYKWTLESIAVIAFNKRLDCLSLSLDKDSEGQKMLSSAVELFNLFYKLDVQPSMWPTISTKPWRRYVEIMDFFTDTNKRYIRECLASADPSSNIPDSERSVLERLVNVDEKVALAMTLDMLLGGIDTTGRTMASAMYYLAQNPDKQELLRKELRTCMPTKDSPITKDILQQLPYLKAVIKETTRLAPVSVGIPRTTVKDMVLSGYQVPKGTDVLAANIIHSMNDKYFPKAKQFVPERWLRTTKDDLSHKNVHQFLYLPFGYGPRSCIGKRLANLELEVGISKVIRNFKLSWNYPEAAFGTDILYGIIEPLKIQVDEVNS